MQYSDKVMDHFKNPRNVGEIPDADGIGEIGNPVCGDVMAFYIKVKDDRIADIKFKTFGCGAAIAVSSIVSELGKGKTLDEAMKINRQSIAKELGGLPPNKMHCSNLGADALHKAIEDYRNKLRQKKKAKVVKKEQSCQETKTKAKDTCPYCNKELSTPDPLCQPCHKKFISCPQCKGLVAENTQKCPHCGHVS